MSIFDVLKQIENREKYYREPLSWIIAGLGNPGEKYERTRHNSGFEAVDRLADTFGCKINKIKFKGLCTEAQIGSKRVLLLKPQTFMNLSGESVYEAAAFYKIPAERVLIFSDDISLPIGKIRVRAKGSSGGHNGLKNIAEKLGTDNFPRIKIGAGVPPHPDYSIIDWVLSKFTDEEYQEISKQAGRAAEAGRILITSGIAEAMQRFN